MKQKSKPVYNYKQMCRRGAEDKTGLEKKENDDLKISIEFQINSTTNCLEKYRYIESNEDGLPMDGQPAGLTDGWTEIPSDRGAFHVPRNLK
jgi:hypothetical protein